MARKFLYLVAFLVFLVIAGAIAMFSTLGFFLIGFIHSATTSD